MGRKILERLRRTEPKLNNLSASSTLLENFTDDEIIELYGEEALLEVKAKGQKKHSSRRNERRRNKDEKNKEKDLRRRNDLN